MLLLPDTFWLEIKNLPVPADKYAGLLFQPVSAASKLLQNMHQQGKDNAMRGTVLPCAAAPSLEGTCQDLWENSTEDVLASAQVFCCFRLDIDMLVLSSTLQGNDYFI